MLRMALLRALSQLVDILVTFAALLACLIWVMPRVASLTGNQTLAAILALLLAIAANLALQLPFLTVGQTIGKGMASLRVVSTNEARPLSLSVMLTREILCKLMSCYFICVPVIAGREGGHEAATETKVVHEPRKLRARAAS